MCVCVSECTVSLLLLLLSLQLTLSPISLVAVLTIGAVLIGALSLERGTQSRECTVCVCVCVQYLFSLSITRDEKYVNILLGNSASSRVGNAGKRHNKHTN